LGHTFGLGTTTITYQATDCCGNTTTRNVTVTVAPTPPPVITVPKPIIVYTCSNSAMVWFSASASSPYCTNVTIWALGYGGSTGSITLGHTFGVGTTTIQCVATDCCGNTANKSFTVTVVNQSLTGVQSAGIKDCFKLPAEIAYRSSQLLSVPHAGAWKNLDVKAQGQTFGVSFMGLPHNLTCATLEIGMAPYRKYFFSTASLNDTISLGVAPAFSTSYIGTLAGSAWLFQGGCGVVFNIPITGAQLTAISLPPHRLDVYVQDSTTVDYAKLHYCYCATSPWPGWDSDLNNATLAIGNQFNTVLPVNAGTNYSATLSPGTTHGIQVGLDSPALGATSNATLSASAVINGQLDANNNPLPDWTVAMTGDGNGNVGVSLPSLNTNVTQVTLTYKLQGVVVKQTTLPVTSGNNALIIMEDGPMLTALTAQNDRALTVQDDLFTIALEAPHNIRECPLCPPTLADSVAVALINPTRTSGDMLTSLQLGANGLDQFEIGRPAVLVGDAWTAVTGDATASASSGQLTVNANDNTATNAIGFAATFTPTNQLALNLEVAQSFQSNGVLNATFTGLLGTNQVAAVQLGLTQNSTGWDMASDFTALGSTTTSYQLYDHGTPVASLAFAGNPQVPVLPTTLRTLAASTNGLTLVFNWNDTQGITLNGNNYAGDELRISPVAPTQTLQAITTVQVEATGVDSISLNEASALAPGWCLQPLAINGDELSVEWSGPAGGALEGARTLNGPWSTVSGQNPYSVVLPAPGETNAAPSQFFRVKSN